ncbi:hypothetical protein LA6_006418 (plasmid) [Marinibacterium anthonyi]|nr:hypothetical protein LA6_006418 [Marinibacterium anthonyi]
MVRRVHIHVDVNEEQALQIKQAARRVHMRPSQYVLDRALRVADHELQLVAEAQAAPPPEDIDRDCVVEAGPAELTSDTVLKRLSERRKRQRSQEYEPVP